MAPPEASAPSKQALERVGQASNVANVVRFLVGEESGWVTGQIIEVSGRTSLMF
jgi:NAD(P)-dependent dehydrogenase (short-subunit alcohol dehydrogenase family)